MSGFGPAFEALTGYAPLRWQVRLFGRLTSGDIPPTCDLPTGLGKTSVIPIWLIALACQAEANSVTLPRRLVYVVNRRTVVDQATNVVEQMRERLLNPSDVRWSSRAEELGTLAHALRSLVSTGDSPLGVSTLRGEFADNEEWKADPSRPAIVVGTIDMIGSKLLFSGYGDGHYLRPHHAGLVGQDALIVHDEAHLTPAFSDLLRVIAEEQARERSGNIALEAVTRPVRVMDLSATSRGGAGASFSLKEDDQEDPIVRERLMADKRLHLHPSAEDSIVDRIVALSKAHESASAKLLVYVRSPDQAQQVARELARSLGDQSRERIALLTGTIRGHERDRLVETNPVYRALLDHESRVQQTVYLVSTSAGEVGIDLDADHLVCDLTTLDSLIQRLGRVNRRGGRGRKALAHIVGDAPAKENASAVDKAVTATLSLLRDWDRPSANGIDVSPRSLRNLLANESQERVAAAFSPKPESPPLTDVLLDAWSLTSVRTMPGRPEVAPFLHGLTDDPPETFVAWRHEILRLHRAHVDEATLDEWFRACRIEARERLRDRTDRVKKILDALLKSHRERDGDKDFPVVLLDERGVARWSKLSAINGSDVGLAYRTVVLPSEAAGLDTNGMLDPKVVEAADGLALDVADEGSTDERRERWLRRRSGDNEGFERLPTGETFEGPSEGLREKISVPLVEPEESEGYVEELDLMLLVSPKRSALENPETAGARQTLDEHTETIANLMIVIAEKLGLQPPVDATLVSASRWHDRGKSRPVWQRYARNEGGYEPLAKSDRYLHWRALGGYRHEFGSLLDAGDGEVDTSAERELMLHLIAAHHGWARPHFEPRSYDATRTSSENQEAVAEVMRRYGRLQERYGRWALAWLESLLRCADIAASKQAAEAAAAPQTHEARM